MARRHAEAAADNAARLLGADTGGVTDGDYVEVPTSEADAQQSAFDELRDDASTDKSGLFVWVYRMPTDEKGEPNGRAKLEHLFTVPIDGSSLDQIFHRVRAEFMTEPDDRKWFVRVQVRELGRGVRWSQIHVVRRGAGITPTAPGIAPAQAGGELGAILAQILKANEAQQARMDEMIARLSAPKPVQEFSLEKMIALQASARQEMVMMMGAMSQMMRPQDNSNSNAMSQMDQMLGMFQKMDQLRNAMGGDNNNGGGLLGTLAPLGMKLLDVVKAQQSAAPAVIPAQPVFPPQLPEQNPAVIPSQQTAVASPQGDNVLFLIKDQLGQLAQLAAITPVDKVSLVAEQVMQAIPEQFDEQLYSILSGMNWWDHLTLAQPALIPHRDWMTALRAEILKSYEPDKAP